MSQLYMNCPPHWNTNEEQIPQLLSKSLTLKVDPNPTQLRKTRNLSFQLNDQDLSSSQSTQSNHELNALGGTISQDQCISSESGQEVSCEKHVGDHLKPLYLMGHQDSSFSVSQFDYARSMNCVPYPCVDPYFNGLLTAYGPPSIVQAQMGLTNTRVPLPGDITEEEPIYVNAKQYHGILRRRQSRAKLEAQNKLIKVRKPYLHESRHLHALNRVRGSGGRFLSSKKLNQPDLTSNHSVPNSIGSHQTRSLTGFEQPHHQTHSFGAATSSSVPNTNGHFYEEQSGHGFPGIVR